MLVFSVQSDLQRFHQLKWFGRLSGFPRDIIQGLQDLGLIKSFVADTRAQDGEHHASLQHGRRGSATAQSTRAPTKATNAADPFLRWFVVTIVIVLTFAASLAAHVVLAPFIFIVLALFPNLMDTSFEWILAQLAWLCGAPWITAQGSLVRTLLSYMYLLDIPCFNFAVGATLDLALALIFTLMRSDTIGTTEVWRMGAAGGEGVSTAWTLFMLVWTGSGVLWEVRQLIVAALGEHVDRRDGMKNWLKQVRAPRHLNITADYHLDCH